jgi:hypothetical protein
VHYGAVNAPAAQLFDERKFVKEIADTFNVHTATIYPLSAAPA